MPRQEFFAYSDDSPTVARTEPDAIRIMEKSFTSFLATLGDMITAAGSIAPLQGFQVKTEIPERNLCVSTISNSMGVQTMVFEIEPRDGRTSGHGLYKEVYPPNTPESRLREHHKRIVDLMKEIPFDDLSLEYSL